MKLNKIYTWELESNAGEIVAQYDEKGDEQSWKKLDTESVVRISFIPKIHLLPRHDVFIDHSKGEMFIRRFARGFLKQSADFNLAEYIHCCVTNRYRFWVFSSGRSIITHNEHELMV